MSGLIKDLIPALGSGRVNCLLTQPKPWAAWEGMAEAQFWSRFREDPHAQTLCCFAVRGYSKAFVVTYQDTGMWLSRASCADSPTSLWALSSRFPVLHLPQPTHATHLVSVWELWLHMHCYKTLLFQLWPPLPFPRREVLPHACCPGCWELSPSSLFSRCLHTSPRT